MVTQLRHYNWPIRCLSQNSEAAKIGSQKTIIGSGPFKGMGSLTSSGTVSTHYPHYHLPFVNKFLFGAPACIWRPLPSGPLLWLG